MSAVQEMLEKLSLEELRDALKWEKGGRRMVDNPIIEAYSDNCVNMAAGELDEEDGLFTVKDVTERWIWYMAEGEQEVSWYSPIMEQANAYFKALADTFSIEYREGRTS